MNHYILDKIVNYCNYQERSHYEVRSKLRSLGCESEEVDQYIALLIEDNILNEQRFTDVFVRSKFNLKNWGKIKIVQALKAHQISEYCIRIAFKAIDDLEYKEKIERLAKLKIPYIKAKNSLEMKAKLYRYLLQKGYESSLIHLVLADLPELN